MSELELFEAALEKSPADRGAFLDNACAGNQPLRERLHTLLARHEKAASFLEAPAAELHRSPRGRGAGGEGPPTVDPSRERPGSVIAGRYKLLEQIGEGGMGTVWVAEQSEPVKRRVALKVIKPGMDSRQVLSRFEAERQALALMDHPNIAKVFDGGMTDEGRPYFVMEYVKGMPVTEYCDNAKLSIQDRLKLFVPVCQAVQHAHQKGVIHRDLKPNNILVCLYDGNPVPKVIDFGLAKAISQPLTENTLYTAHGLMVGTPLYMSPEQAEFNNLDVDTRTDIYSLGVLLYELLTGTTPLEKHQFKDAAFQEILRLIKEVEPTRPSLKISTSVSLPSLAAQRSLEPSQLSRAVRGDLDWIVMKSLEKERSRRYETANGLARDIDRYLSDEPVEACPPSATYRLKKVLRRNKGPVLAAALVLLTLVTGMVGTTWGLIQAARERNRAVQAEQQAKGDRDKALAEKERADEQVAIAQAVNDFLQQDLLRQADSYEQADRGFAADPNLTVREALGRAAERIGDRFQDQPLVEAAIRQAIGEACVGVGGGVGEVKMGVLQLEQALALRKANLGPEHLLTLSSMKSLATAYLWADQPADALVLLEDTVKLRKAKLGLGDADTLEAMRELGVAYYAVRRLPEAIALHEETVKLAKANLGPAHPLTLVSMHQLGLDYRAADRLPEALALREETLKLSQAALSPHHPRTLLYMSSLASAYGHAGRFAEAIALHEETLKLEKAKLGPDHSHTLWTMSRLASSYAALGRHSDALQLHEETLALRKAKLATDHPDTLQNLNSLALALDQVRQFGKAADIRRELLDAQRKQYPATDPRLANALAALGLSLLKAEQFADAEPVVKECLAIREQALVNSYLTFNAKSMVGAALSGQKKYADAEPLLLSGYEGMKQREAKIPVSSRIRRLTEALQHLIDLYTAWDKPDQAVKWRKELDSITPTSQTKD